MQNFSYLRVLSGHFLLLSPGIYAAISLRGLVRVSPYGDDPCGCLSESREEG